MKKQFKTVTCLLKDRRRWCKGANAKDAEGNELENPLGEYAVRWCLVGAVEKIYGLTGVKKNKVMDKLINLLPDGWHMLDGFNDDSTHKEVLALCRKAKV